MNQAKAAPTLPEKVLSCPALLFLYYRIEQILGIKSTGEALVKLNSHIEQSCGYSFVENPAAYENILTSREQIFDISKIVTVNETYFFREGAHFELLSRHFLPQLSKLNRPIRICSAATSIGCEAYSVAMLLDHYGRNGRHAGVSFEFEIDAFDICAKVIETAKAARYTSNAIRGDGADWKHIMDLYLEQDGSEYVVSRDIRKKVNFFPHNVMRGLDKYYDIIFCRNALIYFSSKNRLIVLNTLVESLFNNGLLFVGVSETSAIRHPLLANRYLSDVFYFQKSLGEAHTESTVPFVMEAPAQALALRQAHRNEEAAAFPAKPVPAARAAPGPKPTELRIDCGEVAAILGAGGQPEAEAALKTVKTGRSSPSGEAAVSPSGSELAASAAYFLGAQDYGNADLVLSYLEERNHGALPLFLRGEYHRLRDNPKDAVFFFERAAGKEKAFWPAFYRIASLYAEGNPTRREYRIRKALESLELGKGLKYECFLGGFSPDYFRRILERKSAEVL